MEIVTIERNTQNNMSFTGRILGTFSAKEKLDGIKRPAVKSLKLIESYGIDEDRYAGGDLSRSVMVVGKIAYDIAKEHGIDLEYGSLGENIITDFNPHSLRGNTILEIGDSKIQIMQKCSVCTHLNEYDARLSNLLKECRGVYCKILTSGTIQTGDWVNIKEERV